MHVCTCVCVCACTHAQVLFCFSFLSNFFRVFLGIVRQLLLWEVCAACLSASFVLPACLAQLLLRLLIMKCSSAGSQELLRHL